MRWLWMLFALVSLGDARSLGVQALTPAPLPGIHVEGNRLVNGGGESFVLRGAGLPEFRTAIPAAKPDEFAPYSSTVFSSIRLRWNMNAVRLPLNAGDFESDAHYLPSAAEVVLRANSLELLVILSLPPSPRLLRECGALFKDSPLVMFQVTADEEAAVEELRRAGARQTVIAAGPTGDANAIHLLRTDYRTTRTAEDLDRKFAAPAAHFHVMATDLDPELDLDSDECRSLPAEPADAEALIDTHLQYFDEHAISWIASEFRPGSLITDYRHMYPSSLENGWRCGEAQTRFGIGETIQFHLWGGEMRGVFAVNTAGGFRLARGAIAILYGGVFAQRDQRSLQTPPPLALAGVSVTITDSKGVARKAGLLYVSEGWGQANLIVPLACGTGPARLTVTRPGGGSSSTPITVVDVAPGFWTGMLDGRGAVEGFAGAQRIARCDGAGCHTLPISVAAAGATEVRLLGSGFRHAARLADIHVTIGGAMVPVVGYGPAEQAGLDYLTIRIPPALRGRGERDLVCTVDGHLSNVVRINLGADGVAP